MSNDNKINKHREAAQKIADLLINEFPGLCEKEPPVVDVVNAVESGLNLVLIDAIRATVRIERVVC
jgi:hypothetical protein